MNRIQTVFERGQAFVAYLTAGHPSLEATQAAALALVAGGVDIIEIGVPFSDPVADGPVIQAAMTQALGEEFSLQAVLTMVSELRTHTDCPIVLFSYLNPLLAMGLEAFALAAKQAGVDALLCVDCPFEESAPLREALDCVELAQVILISPSTSPARVAILDKACNAFLYYVCRNATTGIQKALPADYAEKMDKIKTVAKSPVVAGFGIADSEAAAAALRLADGFVVGSYFVKAITEGAVPAKLTQLAQAVDPRSTQENTL